MADIAKLRRVMVELQVQTSDVTDRRLLRAMLECPREAFAPGVDPSIAYLDGEVELVRGRPGEAGRVLLQPMVIGKLLQLASIAATDKVLVVGCASGYIAALCAALARSVVALEVDSRLMAAATTVFSRLGLANIKGVEGPLPEGFKAEAPYDVVVVAGRVPAVPEALAGQLAEHGRMVSVVGAPELSRATISERHGNSLSSRAVFEAQASPLPGFARKAEFSL